MTTTTTTAHRYRLRRRADPYLKATTALSLARTDTEGETAGLPPWAEYLTEEPVTIAGRAYTVTVEVDQDAGKPSDMGDCYGTVDFPSSRELESNWGHPPTPEWPAVRPAGETWTYDPGDTYEADWRERGMARGPAREKARADLIAEGWRSRDHYTGDSPMFYLVGLTDAETGDVEYLGGVDGLNDQTNGRAYLWEILTEMAGELEYTRAVRVRSALDALCSATAHG